MYSRYVIYQVKMNQHHSFWSLPMVIEASEINPISNSYPKRENLGVQPVVIRI